VNLEGRVQRTQRSIFPPGEAKEDWTILRALSEVLKKTLPYDTVGEVRARMEQVMPHFARVNEIVPASWVPVAVRATRISDTPFDQLITNFYMTDPISRASRTMAECTREIVGQPRKEAA
jgi:NADH-quinone oxidoreductase subunit G